MKLSILLMGTIAFTAPIVLAAPQLNKRQNDVPKCADGSEGPANDTFDRGGFNSPIRSQSGSNQLDILAADCRDKCFLREQADGDNKNGVCKGLCINIGRPAPVFQCRSKQINLFLGLISSLLILYKASWPST
jgi:hypothetical protein